MNSIGGDILSLSMRDLIEKYDGDLSKYFLERAQNAINKKLPPLPQSLISFKRYFLYLIIILFIKMKRFYYYFFFKYIYYINMKKTILLKKNFFL